MSIKTGETFPLGTFRFKDNEGVKEVATEQYFNAKKVVLFAVPGAFTPGCSLTHLPGFVVNADKIKDKGVDTIVCLSVNDAFVMGAWGESQNAEALIMLADGNAELTAALGLELDGTGFGMGTRSQRYSMIVDDGTVTAFNPETGPGILTSSAEAILEAL